MPALYAAPFDEIVAQQGLVEVLKSVVGNDVGKFLDPNTGQETTEPAIYISDGNEPSANFPRVIIDYQGDDGGQVFESGWVNVENPDDPPNTIDVPYKDQYLMYSCSITIQSGSKSEVLKEHVLSGMNTTPNTKKSSTLIARKIRKNLMLDRVRQELHEKMNSTVQYNVTITPTATLDQTQIQDSCVMTLFFDTVDRVYDYQGGVFDTIVYDGDLKRNVDDPDPISIAGTVGPVSP